MKQARIRIPSLSYIATFVIGVILFASFWKMWFGSASSTVVLAGITGVAAAVTLFWFRYEVQDHDRKK
jgi:hypothetical protein